MLTEWRKSLENQILAVRAAIKQRQKHVSDSLCSFSSPPESPSQSSFKQVEKNVDFERVWHQTDDCIPAVKVLDEEKESYASDSLSSPPQESPPTFHRTCKKINKNYSGFLEKVWNQKDNSSPSIQEEEDVDEEETKIEFPRSSLMVQEDFDDDFFAQKESGLQLISVNSSKDCKTDSTLSTSSVSASNLSLSTSSRDISNDSSSDSSNVSLCSTQSSASSQESLSSPSFEKIMDKILDLDKLVLSPSCSPVPSKQEPQAEKSENNVAIHQKLSKESPVKSAIETRSTKVLPLETKIPSKNDFCKEYKIVEAVKEGEEKEEDPNEYQMEVNAIYIFLFAVFSLLIFRFIRFENV
uniref:Uncharacterized protein n=1 Tax=Panagrolaimus davidi TaxID=227884 RepID=A0A914PZJ2_9BILA